MWNNQIPIDYDDENGDYGDDNGDYFDAYDDDNDQKPSTAMTSSPKHATHYSTTSIRHGVKLSFADIGNALYNCGMNQLYNSAMPQPSKWQIAVNF